MWLPFFDVLVTEEKDDGGVYVDVPREHYVGRNRTGNNLHPIDTNPFGTVFDNKPEL